MSNYDELPRQKMQTVKIAFDVDGTLRCNGGKTFHAAGIEERCSEFCQEANEGIVTLFRLLSQFKNTELYVWSGGGADYARRFARLLELPVKEANCISKFSGFVPDVAIDDIQETALGKINLIVREK